MKPSDPELFTSLGLYLHALVLLENYRCGCSVLISPRVRNRTDFLLCASYTYHTRQQIHGQLFGKIELTNEAWAEVEEQVAASRNRRPA
jgi:hypothetical protein